MSHFARLVIFALAAALSPLATQSAVPSAASNEVQIKMLLDGWAKAFHDHDIKAIMAMYKPGTEMVAYDVIPPLQYVGYDAYKKDYENFLSQYKGPINIEYRDIHIVTSDTVAYAFGLEKNKRDARERTEIRNVGPLHVRFSQEQRSLAGRARSHLRPRRFGSRQGDDVPEALRSENWGRMPSRT